MEQTFGAFYTSDDLGQRKLPDNTDYLRRHNIFRQGSAEAEALGRDFARRLGDGEVLYLLGFLGTTHNSGLSLLRASRNSGLELIANYEEERFAEVKHFAGYPRRAAEEMKLLLRRLGVQSKDIFGTFYAFDVVGEEQSGMRMLLMNSKIVKNKYYKFITETAAPSIEFDHGEIAQMRENIFAHSPALVAVYRKLIVDLELPADLPCLTMLHHENHAYFSYGVSPFSLPAHREKTTMIACVDGGGDFSSASLFQTDGHSINLLKRNSRANSLGVFYMLCSSLLGGWAALSSEGRYMGAAAWGNGDRLTNPFYKRLRQFFHFAENGEVFYNSALSADGYEGLQEIVGPFVPFENIWKPDAILNVDNIRHSEITRERVDIAAAVQMVFEDALFHIIGDLIHQTRSDQLVLCGGTALNCVANMRLLDHFNEEFYRRYLGMDTRLHLWVPPIPSDQGVVAGAPYQFAMRNGGNPRGNLPSPFLCGLAPTRGAIAAASDQVDFLNMESMGDVNSSTDLAALADWMAFLVSKDVVVGIYQGEAETGPRALGHRSILANPCNPDTLQVLNARVKHRERIRPLAPMVTLDEANHWFELSPGASANEYDAYDYMVLTVKARPAARQKIPAVIHHDGTSRIQIVRKRNNPLIHGYLKALKSHIGVEVSVNTSLNVGTPIVQTPAQALQVFPRSKGIDCVFLIGDDGSAFMAWAKNTATTGTSGIPHLRHTYQTQFGEIGRRLLEPA